MDPSSVGSNVMPTGLPLQPSQIQLNILNSMNLRRSNNANNLQNIQNIQNIQSIQNIQNIQNIQSNARFQNTLHNNHISPLTQPYSLVNMPSYFRGQPVIENRPYFTSQAFQYERPSFGQNNTNFAQYASEMMLHNNRGANNTVIQRPLTLPSSSNTVIQSANLLLPQSNATFNPTLPNFYCQVQQNSQNLYASHCPAHESFIAVQNQSLRNNGTVLNNPSAGQQQMYNNGSHISQQPNISHTSNYRPSRTDACPNEPQIPPPMINRHKRAHGVNIMQPCDAGSSRSRKIRRVDSYGTSQNNINEQPMQRSQSHRDFTNIRPSRNVPDSNRTNLEFDLFPAANDVFVNSNFYMPTTSQLTPVNASVSAMNATLTNTIIRNNEQLTNLIRDNEQLASMERTVEMYLDARAITDRDYDEPPILESNAIDEEIRTSFDGSAPEPARLPSRQQENMFQIPGDINRYAYDTSAVSLLAHITNQGNAEVEALNRQLQHNSNALYFRNHSMSAFTGAAPGGYIIPSSPRMNPFEMYYVLNHSDSAIHGGTYPFVNFASAAQIHSLIHPPNHEQLPVGVSSDQIKKFSTILPFEKDDNGINEEDERCTVCLSEFESGDEIRALPCSHRYHTECIDRWLGINKKCPLCREDIDKNSESNQDTYSTIRVGPSTIPSAQMENVPLPSRVLE